MILRAVIVEDESVARATLRAFLADVDWLEVVGEAADGLTAVRQIDDLRPDIVFLDVELPELDGLGVLARATHKPAVIFTTAYDRFAVSAFEVQALDYLLKPFGRERCLHAVERAKQFLSANVDATAANRAADALSTAPLKRLFVRHRNSLVPVTVGDIMRLEAEDDYVALVLADRRYLVQVRMQDFEHRLDPERFIRVHRRHIVNLDFVAAVRPYDGVRLAVEMRDGTKIVASRSRSGALRRLAV